MTVPASQHTVRQHNRALVLGSVARHPGRSRAQLAALTGLTRATVSTLVDELLANGLVVELEPASGARGRPGSPVQLNPDAPVAVGIEINVDHTAVCLLDLTGAVRARRTVAVDNAAITPRAGLRRAVQVVRTLSGSTGRSVAGVGLALPGLVSSAGVVGETPNLPRWAGAEVRTLLGQLLGAPPAVVDNEANLAALAEHWYAAAPRDFIYVSGEIGVGGGIVLDGQLYRGVRGFAGEIGHLPVDPDGPVCGCGSRGCLEQLAGKKTVLTQAGARDDEELVTRVARGDRVALDALDGAASALGTALGAAVNLVDVPNVVLGGFYARLGDPLLEALRAALGPRVASRAPVTVSSSTLGPDAAMLGAAGAVVEQTIAAGSWPEQSPAL